VRGKKAKQLRVDRTAEREAARRKQRQQTLFTVIVIAIIVGIGGVLVAVTINEESQAAREAAEEASELAEKMASEAAASESATEGPDDRKVACKAEAPANAGEEKPTFKEPEQVLEDGVDYGAVITTSCGTVTVDLYEDEAPETVNSFVFLAQEGFFDGLEIFRNATSIGALQTGAGTNEATWDIGYTIPDELDVAEKDKYPPGTLAMANSGPNSGGSQFFFVYNDLFQLDPAYAVFGLADEKGIEVLAKIGAIPVVNPTAEPGDPDGEKPSQITYMESVKITTKK
jgi:peptidyl-prolyl cis-trans isomerase B (cyclophilin B)